MKKNANKLFFCSASVVVEAQKVINNIAIGTGFSLYFHYFRKVREDKAGGGVGALTRERHLFDIMDQGVRAYSEGGVLIREVCAHSGGARSFEAGRVLIQGNTVIA